MLIVGILKYNTGDFNREPEVTSKAESKIIVGNKKIRIQRFSVTIKIRKE